MTLHIRQPLLRDPEERYPCFRGDVLFITREPERNPQSRALRGLRQLPQPGGQQKMRLLRAQQADRLAHLLKGVVGEPLGRLHGIVRCCGITRAKRERLLKLDAKTGERVADAVVHVAGEVEQFRLVGVAQIGEQPGSSAGAALFFTPATVARLAGTTEPLALLIAGDGSTSPDALAPRIAAAIGDAEVRVRSGAAAVADDLEQARMGVQDLTRVLTLFAVIGVGLGGVVAVNAFALTLAQRRREHALLRTLGASPRQLLALAGGEALLVALLGGLGGWGLGFAVAGAMQRAFAETTGGFSSDALGTVAVRASLPALAATLLCGSLAALGAVAVPAWRAARVAPLASLRDAGIEQGARSRQRSWLALAAFALMVGAALLQRLAAGGAPPAASLVGLLVGVATLTLAAPGLLAAAAPLAGRLGLLLAPRVGDLARASVARNPRRVR